MALVLAWSKGQRAWDIEIIRSSDGEGKGNSSRKTRWELTKGGYANGKQNGRHDEIFARSDLFIRYRVRDY